MEFLRVDSLIVLALLGLTAASFLKFAFDMDDPDKRGIGIVYFGIGIILLVIGVRVALFRLILAAGFKVELAIWIAIFIGTLTILGGVIYARIQVMNRKYLPLRVGQIKGNRLN